MLLLSEVSEKIVHEVMKSSRVQISLEGSTNMMKTKAIFFRMIQNCFRMIKTTFSYSLQEFGVETMLTVSCLLDIWVGTRLRVDHELDMTRRMAVCHTRRVISCWRTPWVAYLRRLLV